MEGEAEEVVAEAEEVVEEAGGGTTIVVGGSTTAMVHTRKLRHHELYCAEHTRQNGRPGSDGLGFVSL